jgi:hypothetical protein
LVSCWAEIVDGTLRAAVPLPSEARIGQRFEVSRAPLYVHDHVLADQEGHRQSHRLHLPIATVVAHPALEAEPFVTPEQLYEVLRDAGLEITCTDYVRARVPYPPTSPPWTCRTAAWS